MATPSKYVTLELTVGERYQSVAGYRVIGDYVEDSVWYITLQRPESDRNTQKAPKGRKKAGNATKGSQSSTLGLPDGGPVGGVS